MASTGAEPDTVPQPEQVWLALGLGIAAVAMLPIASTGTNLSFPDMEITFSGANRSTLSWALSGYSIVIAAFTLLGGQLTDRLDGDRVFRVGLSVLAVASLLVAVAPNPAVLILGRCLHGVGGALIVPSSLLVVTSRWPEHRHTFAIGLWTMAFPIGASVAPAIGAGILEVSSWRWVFVAVAVLAGAVALVQAAALRTADTGQLEEGLPDITGHPDYVGVVVGSGGVGLAALGIVQGPNWGWTSVGVLVALGMSGLSVALFIHRSRHHPRPMVDLEIFSIRSYSVSTSANVFVSVVGAATWLLWPLLMIEQWGYSRITVGLAMTPAPIVVAICSAISARVAETAGYRGTLLVGTTLLIVSNVWLLLALGPHPDYAGALLPGLLLNGAGMGLTFAPLNAAALSDMPTARYGQANAAFATTRFLSNAIGIAAAVAALDSADGAFSGFDRAFTLMAAASVVPLIVVAFAWPRRLAPPVSAIALDQSG
jgi:EmrB/QacA subfamily drug resistance transporter